MSEQDTTEEKSAYSADLLPHHLKMIVDSAVTPEVVAERGYRSATSRAELKRIGFSESQCLVPALLIPTHGVHGSIVNYQLRPDTPRIKDGKPLKYETPFKSQMALDVPPRARPDLGNPAIPLFITEGARKADAGVSIGLCCIALLGVWNWRGTNDHGGKTALPDWELVALNDRSVFIVFDSDVMEKKEVHVALGRIGAFLGTRSAKVRYVYLPSAVSGAKVGLDDFLAAGNGVNDLITLASSELRPAPDAGAIDNALYVETDMGTVWRRPTRDGPVDQLLCNFTARIVEEVTADDGANVRADFVVEGTLAGGTPLPRITVPVSRFAPLDWPLREWGARAIVGAGMGIKDRLREAIQRLSPEFTRRTVLEHPGWRNLPDHGWCYLHGGGAINSTGTISGVEIALRGDAGRIAFPDPPTGTALIAAVRASLALLDLAHDAITAPLLAAAYRAALCELVPVDLSVFLVGPSGVYKTETSALVMQHYGAEFDRLHLPGQWSATPNFIERLCFDFKDAPVVIDDFAPTGSQNDIARFHSAADRVFRSVGNRGGRGRMQADGTVRANLPPRGLVIATGEDAPRGQSVRARLVIIEVAPGDINLEQLTAAQDTGRRGVLVAALAGFVQWMAAHFEEMRERCPLLLLEFRRDAQANSAHARTPDAVAHLALGWWAFLRFAVDANALSQSEAEAMFRRVWAALGELGSRQTSLQSGEEPARRFLDLLGSAIDGGFAHVASINGDAPHSPGAWGWREAVTSSNTYEKSHLPQGTRAGWVEGDDLYLNLESALAAAQKVGQGSGSVVSVGPKTLAKRLHERGHLRTIEPDELQIRKTLDGSRRRVLHLAASAITPEESGQSGQSGRTSEESAPLREDGKGCGRVLRPDFVGQHQEPGHTIRPDEATFSPNGGIGRIGGISEGEGEPAQIPPRVEVDGHRNPGLTVNHHLLRTANTDDGVWGEEVVVS